MTELTNNGALTGNFAPAGANFESPIGIAIDSSGNVWVDNNDGGTMALIIGAATPVLTPMVACFTHSPPTTVCKP